MTTSLVASLALLLLATPIEAKAGVRVSTEASYARYAATGHPLEDSATTSAPTQGDASGGNGTTGSGEGAPTESKEKESGKDTSNGDVTVSTGSSALDRSAIAIALVALLVAIAQLFVILGLRRRLRSIQGPPPEAEVQAP